MCVKISFTGRCAKCVYADLELYPMLFDDDRTYWSVLCKHEAACNAAEERARREAEHGQTD